MTQVKDATGRADAKKEIAQFKTATATLKGVWNTFTAADKQNALTNLSTGWSGATALQKAEALRVAVCLLYVVVAYLAFKALGND